MIARETIYQIDLFKNDFINGSSALAFKALDIFENAVSLIDNVDDKSVIPEIASKLCSAKPSMAAIWNIVNAYYYGLVLSGQTKSHTEIADSLRNKMKIAVEQCIASTMDRIFSDNNSVTIVTCSYSSSVIKFLEVCRDENKEIIVYAVDSFWKENNYGSKVIDQCKQMNIKAFSVDDTEIPDYIDNIDCVLIGADAIIENRGVINGIPSLSVANVVMNKKPVYIIAESFKKTDFIKIEDGFEFIPNDLITEIFTDNLF